MTIKTFYVLGVVLFTMVIDVYQASAQPPVFEKIREAQHRIEGLNLQRQIITVQGVIPVAGGSKTKSQQRLLVRSVRHKTLVREVAVVGLNSNTGELKDFILSWVNTPQLAAQ